MQVFRRLPWRTPRGRRLMVVGTYLSPLAKSASPAARAVEAGGVHDGSAPDHGGSGLPSRRILPPPGRRPGACSWLVVAEPALAPGWWLPTRRFLPGGQRMLRRLVVEPGGSYSARIMGEFTTVRPGSWGSSRRFGLDHGGVHDGSARIMGEFTTARPRSRGSSRRLGIPRVGHEGGRGGGPGRRRGRGWDWPPRSEERAKGVVAQQPPFRGGVPTSGWTTTGPT